MGVMIKGGTDPNEKSPRVKRRRIAADTENEWHVVVIGVHSAKRYVISAEDQPRLNALLNSIGKVVE